MKVIFAVYDYFGMSVQVGVRVRPFNKREEQLGSKLCIEMEGSLTHILDADGVKKSFNYDYSFWSHDGFEVDENGYNQPVGDKYSDQRKVYDEIGSSILVNAWQGYNCCLFAYGQTGSGKSYSMIGYGSNKGIIPIVCDQIFQKIQANQDGTRSFQVKVSMLEIYNEHVRDLLTKNKKQELKICEHKTLGVYVEGLQKFSVDSYEKIAKKIDEGSNNRSIAATLMNQSSSRSHTIVSLNFVQKIQISMEQTSVKYSMIHLVDLAGSQCVGKTGVDSKDRLRETAKINQSLSTLGRVIEILAENCGKKEKQKIFVPYRDSKLTFILRSALGGNSRTAMICAISPADDNYQQTLSTLRYASRAKKIQNKAIVNESDVDKLIRVLRQQNQMLKQMLQEARQAKKGINQDMISGFNEMNKNMVDMGIVNVKEEESFLHDLEDDSNYQDYNSNTANQSVYFTPLEGGVNQSLPFLTNISEDQLLSFRIKYSCEKLTIGNKQGSPKPDVVLASLGIQPNHALIFFDSLANKCYLEIIDENAANYTYINGIPVIPKTKEELFHLDRVIFGTGCVFLLMFKGQPARQQNPTQQDIDYQYAIDEMLRSNQSIQPDSQKKTMIQQQQLRKKLVGQIQLQFETNKRQNEQSMKKQIQQKEREYHQRIKDMERMKEEETARLQKELMEKEEESKKLEEERQRIEAEVQKYLEENKVSRIREQAEKQELMSTKQTLERKMSQIKELEERMSQLQAKTEQKKQQLRWQLKRQEQEVKKDLQIQTIICHNENIINQYKLQLNKRLKNANEVKQFLIKKQRIELQKQLVELVPQVEKFNLIAKEMKKRVECGLSIEYRYISEAEIVEVVKNKSYKSKLKITVHVINREEGRSYYWPLDIFRNRLEHADELWEEFIRAGKNFKYNRDLDPYWDPQSYQAVAYAHLTLQCLMFNISFQGDVPICRGGKKIGLISVNIYPCDSMGQNNLSIDNKGENQTYKITSPHQQVQKSIYFFFQIDFIDVLEQSLDFQSMKLEYELLEGIKMVKHSTEVIFRSQMTEFKYKKLHVIKEISQTTIMHFMEKPVTIQIQVVQNVASTDELTSRSSFSLSNSKGSFAIQLEGSMTQDIEIHEFQNVSPPKAQVVTSEYVEEKPVKPQLSHTPSPKKVTSGVIYQNTDITKKISDQYHKKKSEQTPTHHNRGPIDMKKKNYHSVQKSVPSKKKADENCHLY